MAIAEILLTLAKHDVRFIAVGGIAAVLRGAPINTRDADIVYEIVMCSSSHQPDVANVRDRHKSGHTLKLAIPRFKRAGRRFIEHCRERFGCVTKSAKTDRSQTLAVSNDEALDFYGWHTGLARKFKLTSKTTATLSPDRAVRVDAERGTRRSHGEPAADSRKGTSARAARL
jgi:hypothetical protein